MPLHPDSASWLNQVERFFGLITDSASGEAFSRVSRTAERHQCTTSISITQPKPSFWTKSAGEILEKVARAKQASESQH